MRSPVRMGVVLTIIGLIIFGYGCPLASIAHAQDAWVLWQYVDNNVNGQRGWQLLKAFPKHEQCAQEQRRVFEDDKRTFTGHSNPSRRFTLLKGDDIDSYMFYRSSDGAQIIVELNCLPNTIDPRK